MLTKKSIINFLKKNWVFISVIALCVFSVENTVTQQSNGMKRIRIKWGLPFCHKYTYVITDINPFNNDKVTHIFNYSNGLAYQFFNGKF